MIAEILRLIESENSKRKRKSSAQTKKDNTVKKSLEKEVIKELVTIRREKKVKKEITHKSKSIVMFKVGDKVRLLDGESVGSIDAIEKKKAIVNYGIFTTQVNVDQLELVK
jgi:DNA mismatch repair protein MutS2